MARADPIAATPLDPLLADYAPQPGVADELFEAPGRIRPVWRDFVDGLAALPEGEIADRCARGDRYLRDAGVFYRRYTADAQQERDWPLSHVPVILSQADWDGITEGLTQRAELLERVVADLYGPGDLVRDGQLPAALLAQSPHWLRPMVGVAPRGGHWLHLLAFEIGRSPDGSWVVLGDRAQAPSGAGYALETRMATSRVFADPFPHGDTHRLAGWFRSFRDAMLALRDRDDGRVAILTPGPGTDTYFEHAYIARYLGLMLLEGEDLVARDGAVMVRTVAGLQPVSVLWRRLDAGFLDPLELDEDSRIGTPGLIEALRGGGLAMLNAPGSGVLETRALMAFLPRIAERLLGAPLKLPNIATWWCGGAAERAYVKAHAHRMMIGAALSCDLPFDTRAASAPGAGFRHPDWPDRDAWIDAEAAALVGQEAVTLSTTPAWRDGKLVARPMTVRVFAARTPTGWCFMPGGYARIGQTADTTALAMQQGGAVADVWIRSDRPVPRDTLLPEAGGFRRSPLGQLPSRAADNLFWLGRYVERTEALIRLLRARHLRLAETGSAEDPRLHRLTAHLEALGVDPQVPVPPVLTEALDQAAACAAKVRDRFSVDGWAALRDLASTAHGMTGTARPGDDAAHAMSVLLRKITGFSGLVHDNMYRFIGWRFLSIGRALERADALALALADFTAPEAPPGCLDIAVELGDSVLVHQRRYRIETSRETVLDLLALDDRNPRAIAFQIDRIREHVAELPGARDLGRPSALARAVLVLQTELAVAEPLDLDPTRLGALRAGLADLSGHLTSAYLR